MEDLFNPSISTLDLCNLHQLSLPELEATLESETYKQAVKAFERINAARTAIIEPEAKALAAARLADQLKDKPTTPAHAETQRKAATKLLSSTSRDRKGVIPSSPTPTPTPSPSPSLPIPNPLLHSSKTEISPSDFRPRSGTVQSSLAYPTGITI